MVRINTWHNIYYFWILFCVATTVQGSYTPERYILTGSYKKTGGINCIVGTASLVHKTPGDIKKITFVISFYSGA